MPVEMGISEDDLKLDYVEEVLEEGTVEELQREVEDLDLDDEVGRDNHETFITYSTDTANYIQSAARHDETTEVDDWFEEVDTVVLETGVVPYEELRTFDLLAHTQFEELMGKGVEEEIESLYAVDVPLEEEMEQTREWIGLRRIMEAAAATAGVYLAYASHPGFAATAFPFLHTISAYAANNGHLKETSSLTGLSHFYDATAFRSAVSARKIDEFVAPKEAAKRGEKPTIYLEYGAAHLDMKHYIKHDWLRDVVIGLHGLHDYPSILDGSYMDKVCEINFENPFDEIDEEGRDYDMDEMKELELAKQLFVNAYDATIYEVADWQD